MYHGRKVGTIALHQGASGLLPMIGMVVRRFFHKPFFAAAGIQSIYS